MDPFRASHRRRGFLPLVFVTLVGAFVAGCESDSPTPNPTVRSSKPAGPPAALPPPVTEPFDPSDLPPAPSEEEWTVEMTAKVEASCGACHSLPDPESLTRARWAMVIPTMTAMTGPPGTAPPDEETVALSLAYYTRRAKDSLGPLPSYSPESTPRFKVEHFTPPGLEREKIPAVAHVSFTPLERTDRREVLIAEMRTQVLMLHIPWAPKPVRDRIRPLIPELDYPVRVKRADLNADGLPDLITAGIGGMDPTNERNGSLSVSMGREDRTFDSHVVRDGLGRTCDVAPVDLDGDGDLDLVVSAFGWRGPGELFWMENVDPTANPPRFVSHALDDRDGFIHIAPHDYDGDGDTDLIALLSQEHEQVCLFVNDGAAKFERRVVYEAPHPAWGHSGLQRVDLDGDGDQDLLVTNGDTLDDDLLKPYHGVRWLENRGGLQFESHAIAALPGCEAAVATDLDGDGDIDVVATAFLPQISPAVWRQHRLDSVIWAENRGGAKDWKVHSLEKERCLHPTVDAADYNGDGRVDIVVGNYVWLESEGQARVRSDYITLFTAK